MLIKAEQKYIRMSPRKVRLVVDAIRGLKPKEALDQLMFMHKRAAVPVGKTIKQAMANAVKNLNIEEESLVFKSIEVGEGPTFKRWNAVSRGRAHQILKRTSHIKVILNSDVPKATTEVDKPKKETKPERKGASVESTKRLSARKRTTK